jgi:hypothetical protein
MLLPEALLCASDASRVGLWESRAEVVATSALDVCPELLLLD